MKKCIMILIILVVSLFFVISQEKPMFNTCIRIIYLDDGINHSKIIEDHNIINTLSIISIDYRFNVYKDDYWDSTNDEIIQNIFFNNIENNTEIINDKVNVYYCVQVIQYSTNDYISGSITTSYYLINEKSDLVIKNDIIYQGNECIKFNKYIFSLIRNSEIKS